MYSGWYGVKNSYTLNVYDFIIKFVKDSNTKEILHYSDDNRKVCDIPEGQEIYTQIADTLAPKYLIATTEREVIKLVILQTNEFEDTFKRAQKTYQRMRTDFFNSHKVKNYIEKYPEDLV